MFENNKNGGVAKLDFRTIIENANNKVGEMAYVRGFYLDSDQPHFVVRADGVSRIVATDEMSVDEVGHLNLRVKKFYSKMGQPPILTPARDEDLTIYRGQSLYVLNLGVMNFCEENLTTVQAKECLKNIAKEGITVNNLSRILARNDPESYTNFVEVLEARRDIKYGDLLACAGETVFGNLGLKLPARHERNEGEFGQFSRSQLRNLRLCDISRALATDAINWGEIVPFLREFGRFGFVVNTACGEFREYCAKDAPIMGVGDGYFVQKLYTYGVPSAFISGVVVNDLALINDELSDFIYSNFGDRNVYNCRGELIFSPSKFGEMGEVERFDLWQSARENSLNANPDFSMEK